MLKLLFVLGIYCLKITSHRISQYLHPPPNIQRDCKILQTNYYSECQKVFSLGLITGFGCTSPLAFSSSCLLHHCWLLHALKSLLMANSRSESMLQSFLSAVITSCDFSLLTLSVSLQKATTLYSAEQKIRGMY
jgi:hypothetical protein